MSPRRRIHTVLTCHTTLQDRPRLQGYAVDGRGPTLVVYRIYVPGLLQEYPGSCMSPHDRGVDQAHKDRHRDSVHEEKESTPKIEGC